MFYIIATIIISIIAIILILTVTLQSSKSSGLSGAISGGSSNTWSRSRGKTKDEKLARITLIAGIIFFVVAILLNVAFFTQL